jgi:ribosomal small subunit protein bTHX
MGKGDKKSKRGKICIGSYGVSRPRRKHKNVMAAAAARVKRASKKSVKIPKEVKAMATVFEPVVETVETPQLELFVSPAETVVEAPVVETAAAAVPELADEAPKAEAKPKKEKKAAEPKKKAEEAVTDKAKKEEEPKKKKETKKKEDGAVKEKSKKAEKKPEGEEKPKAKKSTKKTE